MLSRRHQQDLEEMGYTVIDDVLRQDECDTAIGQYRRWLSTFKPGTWPYSMNSLILRYGVGHMEPTWFVRLKAKKVFAQLWETDKLLTSFDAIAIGRPPEQGTERFHIPGDHWFHLDQNADRVGLHAYQGAVYLEEACEDDWTLQVLEGSHRFFDEFFEKNVEAKTISNEDKYYAFNDEDVDYMEKKGCVSKRVPVPKGGMVLWDSRLVHANANPIKGRRYPGRWRYCVMVCMTPAIWASEKDMARKKEAYERVLMTSHWPSQGIHFFNTSIPSFAPQDLRCPKSMPSVAQTLEAQQLAGNIPYNFSDGQPNGDRFMPVWKTRQPIDENAK